MPPLDRRHSHQQRVRRLQKEMANNTQPLYVKKRTISNLFRYDGRRKASAREVDLSAFDKPLYIDTDKQTLEVQGLATYESIVDFVLPHGLAPTVTPELKRITVGGAIVGIGIETNSFRYGFVHDSLLEAEVLLPDGRVVVCSPDNEYADLFHGLPNSYGTLGYILRATIRLRTVTPYVQLTTKRVATAKALAAAMEQAVKAPTTDYIESLLYAADELYLIVGKHVESASELTSIYGQTIFYREISRPGTIVLKTKDYLFRYDPEWFWALPETRLYRLFRALAPVHIRNSGFYAKYVRWQQAVGMSPEEDHLEKLIQDWEVPWDQGVKLLDFALDNLLLDNKPLLAAPVQTFSRASSYPMPPGKLYLNLGSYSLVQKRPGQSDEYHHTKLMDAFCFRHKGIKMLYSTTFLDEKDFTMHYGGKTYADLKATYDPQQLLPSLYQKAVQGR